MYKTLLHASVLVGIISGLVALQSRAGRVLTTPDSFLIESGQAGGAHVGMTVDEAFERFGRARCRLVPLFYTEQFSPGLSIGFPGAGFVTSDPQSLAGRSLIAPIQTRCGDGAYVLTALRIQDARFRTRTGLGVGSTLGEIRRAEPETRVDGFYTDDGAHATVGTTGISLWFAPGAEQTDDAVVAMVTVSAPPQTWSQCK